MSTSPTYDRAVAAIVTLRNGAWLIALVGPLATPEAEQVAMHEGWPPCLMDAANSLDWAKRLARERAEHLGYLPAWGWRSGASGAVHTLTAGHDPANWPPR